MAERNREPVAGPKNPRVVSERFSDLTPLGSGGMGEVFRAHDRTLGHIVALKILHENLSGHARLRRRFQREAAALRKLRHPNVVQLFDYFEDGDDRYFSMEYLDGGSLAARLLHGPMDPAEAVALVADLAEGLHAAHGAGIIHRDVKPENILFGADGRPRLVDFGVAKFTRGKESAVLTLTREMVGTLRLLPPELLSGGRPTRTTDVYQLVAVLYQALTGSHPLAGRPLEEVVDGRASRAIPLPSAVRTSLGTSLDEIVMRGLAVDPTHRPTAATLRDALQRWLEPATVPAPSTALLSREGKRFTLTHLAAAFVAGMLATLLLMPRQSTLPVLRYAPHPSPRDGIARLVAPAAPRPRVTAVEKGHPATSTTTQRLNDAFIAALLNPASEAPGHLPPPPPNLEKTVKKALTVLDSALRVLDFGGVQDTKRLAVLERVFRTALRHGVQPGSARFGLGACLTLLNTSTENARQHLKESLRLGTVHPRVFQLLALLAALEGRLDEEIANLESSVEHGFAGPPVFTALARAYATRDEPGDVERARKAIVETLRHGSQYGEGLEEHFADPQLRTMVRSLRSERAAQEARQQREDERAHIQAACCEVTSLEQPDHGGVFRMRDPAVIDKRRIDLWTDFVDQGGDKPTQADLNQWPPLSGYRRVAVVTDSPTIVHYVPSR